MFNRLKHFGACGLILWYALNLTPLFINAIYPKHRSLLPAVSLGAQGNIARTISLFLFAWLVFGVIILMIDAFRRSYACQPYWPYALAAMGPLTFGLSLIPYYAVWGVHSLYKKQEVYGLTYCQNCCSTSNKSKPARTFFDKVYGMILLGRMNYCADCKSYVQTLWIFIIVPLFPVGSYRILPQGPGAFLSRRVNLQWRQAFGTAWFWWGAMALFIIWMAA